MTRTVGRLGWAATLGLVAAAVTHAAAQHELWTWYIEDAAISFAYARNWAEGWGLVRFPGDERVEAYSNPLWVALLALGQAVGVDSFTGSKWLALGLGPLVALPALFAYVRGAARDRFAVAAAWVLALDATFVIWSASGLENALFGALLAAAMWRTTCEVAPERRMLAPALWLGVALTRPEGIAYAAIGGAWMVLLELWGRGRLRRIAAWTATFAVAFGVYHAARYAYFAYPFPATYYAKLGDTPLRLLGWETRAWTYLRGYCAELGRLWFAPVFFAGVVGLDRRWRVVAVLGLSAWLAAALLPGGVEPLVEWGWMAHRRSTPDEVWWRVSSLLAIAALAPLLGAGTPGWRHRGLAWLLLVFGLAFSVRSGGDWMRGYRWLSLVAVPAAALFGLGLASIVGAVAPAGAGRLRRLAGWGLLVGVTAASIAPQRAYLDTYRPETSPNSVHRRVRHYEWAMDQLHLEHADVLDHDMGGMLWWGPERLGVVRDTRGLADIAFALHRFQRPFVLEYAWDEYPFEFAHGHASTQGAMRVTGAAWREDYIEFPGYGGAKKHTGNYVRKDLLMRPWDGPTDRAARFTGPEGDPIEVLLHGLHLPAPHVTPGSSLFIEVGLQVRGGPRPVRLLLFVHDDERVVTSWSVPLGLEDWYPVERWGEDEVFYGRIALPLSDEPPLGAYGVGVVVVDGDRVLAADAPPDAPLLARGERRWSDRVVHFVDHRTMTKRANRTAARAREQAASGDCERAVTTWAAARANRARSRGWRERERPATVEALARCFAARAGTQERPDAVASMREAQRWDRTLPEVWRTGRALAAPWYAEGLTRWEDGQLEAAYGLFRDAIAVDPSHAWARRRTEELRVQRLGLR